MSASSEPQHDPEQRDAERRDTKPESSIAPDVVIASRGEAESFVDAFARLEEARRLFVIFTIARG